jgi:enoyl-CoA hydratase
VATQAAHTRGRITAHFLLSQPDGKPEYPLFPADAPGFLANSTPSTQVWPFMSLTNPLVSAEKRGVLGLLTLKRPGALNALNLEMVQALDSQLAAWAVDDDIQIVAIGGEGPRAFCAGGDIRAWLEGGPETALEFLRTEYRLNERIATYTKPFMALMHGIVMGGGAGLSIHARWRLADVSLVFAMPETAIGFVPDIGSTYFLPRCPGGIGVYLALTAERIGFADAKAAGLVTHGICLAQFDVLLEKLAAGEAAEQVIETFAIKSAPGPLASQRARLDTLFAASSVEAVLERLARDGGDFALGASNAIRANAPTSLKLALLLLRRGRDLSLRECLNQEYRAAVRLFTRPDFKEGVRAALIDKDRKPSWQPGTLAALSDAEIAGLAAPLHSGELCF